MTTVTETIVPFLAMPSFIFMMFGIMLLSRKKQIGISAWDDFLSDHPALRLAVGCILTLQGCYIVFEAILLAHRSSIL